MVSFSKFREMTKLIKPLYRNGRWLRASTPLSIKVRYYFSVAASFIRMVMLRQKSIFYLDKKFYFDNPATPLNLQTYPYEISKEIIKNTTGNINKVLDIGGNIGQFASTMAFFNPKAKIDVFEPNSEIFALLKVNCKSKNIRLYNFGIGPEGKRKLFYEPNRSATGSLFRENSSENADSVKELAIEITDDISSKTNVNKYDLIVIDVEGFEFDVIKNIYNISTRYIYIEVSTNNRKKNYSHSKLFKLISNQFGNFDIAYQTNLDSDDILGSYLLHFK